MDKGNFDIFRSLVRRVLKAEKTRAVVGVVQSVESEGYTIKPNNGEPNVFVSYLPDETIKLIPEVGALACAVWNNATDSYTVSVSGVADVVINGGSLGGLVKAAVKRELEIMSNRIDTVYSALSDSPTLAQDGGETYKLAIVAALALQTQKEDFSDIINDKVKQ